MRQLSQVAPEFIERRGVALAVPLTGRRLAKKCDGQLSRRQQIGAQAPENFSADALFFPQQPEQEMLAPDVVVAEQPGLLDAVFDDFLDARAEGNLTERHRGAATGQVPFDLKPNLLRGETHLLDDHEGDPVRLTEDSQDQVFGPQIIVLVTLSLLPRQDDDLSTLIRESFEHPSSFVRRHATESQELFEIVAVILSVGLLPVKPFVRFFAACSGNLPQPSHRQRAWRAIIR